MEALALRTYTADKPLAETVNDIISGNIDSNYRMTRTELAVKVNCSRTLITQYLNGKYQSDPAEVETKLEKFVEDWEEEHHAGKAAPQEGTAGKTVREKTQYFESKDYVQTLGVCSSCQQNVALGIVIAKSGFGKTHALRKYAGMPRVIYIEGNETMNCKDIVRRIENRIGMQRSYGSIDERTEKIIDFFNINEGYLIIMDEADKLINKYTQKKIELLRNITDGARVGLVLAGEPMLEPLLKAYDARFANRMDFYYKLRGLSEQEVRDYLEGYDIEEAAMAEFLTRAQNSQTGCFRLLDRTLNNVIRILRDSGQTKVTTKVISQASSMMML